MGVFLLAYKPVGGCWYFTKRLSGESGPYVFIYVCMHALPPAGDRRAEGVGFNLRVCGQLC